MSSQQSFTFSPGTGTPIDRVASLLSTLGAEPYYAYERQGHWHVGIGSLASLAIGSDGQHATISTLDGSESLAIESSLADVARNFLRTHPAAGKVFGFAGFNYAPHIKGLMYHAGRWPLLTLMIPQVELNINSGGFTISGGGENQGRYIESVLKGGETPRGSPHMPDWQTDQHRKVYMQSVEDGLSQIREGRLAKVILSRAVDLPGPVNMPQTLLTGRKSNTPRTTFCLSHGGFQATGFSPELVMSLENGRVTTEPLAGTRSCGSSDAERLKLRQELLSDSKEIVEHVLSVKAAVEELEQICSNDTVVVDDFMSIRERGKVQHLGSRVCGQLNEAKDAWDAFDVLFPSITASGIPKQPALEVITSLETRPRELYSGSVIMLEGSDFFEGALVLRSVYQDEEKAWVQAGAGIIDQSEPAREFTETVEKLSTIAPFVVPL
ncbi:hypothetical protein D7B24_006556 [Verticillium nonalfalfae]|uniref:Chorismate-utilising enzyme C-terminal domain-containing protein n=1 Tax=Verticillium nonalfalfae TaxID=1051616 RepID=A0A3M9YAN6_9PEZI|nr:uncharacterized protein D7B24_006556 [Verticillium nonalfalfae]RNJ57032.1 hypothetical protein D7B24_006556 [Verticillium nonalfalfae]